MKKKKKNLVWKVLLIIAILLVTLFFCRGCAYRTVVSYKDSGGRKNYKVKDKNLSVFIEDNIPQGQAKDIESIIDLSQQVTDKALRYSSDIKENDPNKLVLLKRANNTGYAGFTAATGNYLIDKYKLSKVWEAKPVKGKIYLLGNDMYAKTKSKSYKDVDFVIFRNKATGREICVDPLLYDKWGIDRINKY